MKYIQVDDEGNQVELTELPDELVKSHPKYREVLTESIDRRKEIKTLKEQLEAKPVELETKVELNLEEIEKGVTEKVVISVLSALAEREQTQKTLDKQVSSIMDDFALPSKFKDTITLLYEVSPEKARQQAQILAESVKPFTTVKTEVSNDDLMKSVRKKLKLE